MLRVEQVSTFQGTDSRREFSTGNVYPATGVPRGLTYWTPQTSDTSFLFDRREQKLAGFRATHSPSPWMDDYGHFDVMPIVGPIEPTSYGRASAYRIDRAVAQPHRFACELIRYQCRVEMTATRSCGMFAIDFPADCGEHASVVVQTGLGRTLTMGVIDVAPNADENNGDVVLRGQAQSHSDGVKEGFGCYFVMTIRNADVVGGAAFDAKGFHPGEPRIRAPRAGGYLQLRPRGRVIISIATSFISYDQAQLNLKREIGDHSFEAVAARTAAQWEAWLSRVRPADHVGERERRTLDSCMYRVGLFPMPMHEFDEDNRPHHHSPHTGRIERGVLYTNNGFWDTHRTVYPLLALIDREGFGEIVDGYLAHARQGGWLPKWCSPGYRDCMIGSHADVVIADAIMNGIEGFDYQEAYAAIRRSAFEPVSGHGKYGRAALEEYITLGYVPNESAHASVSWTLDNAHCDWCIAQVAATLGHHEDAKVLSARSKNYCNLWHAGSKLVRPRDRQGNWIEPWSEFAWGGPYVEGGPWQHSFHVPHDPQGLAELCGGVDGLIDRLEQMLALPPRFEAGTYGFEIHEMTEMALAVDEEGRSFGQYAHSNQPVHAFLWLPAQLGRHDWSRRHIDRVMRSLYSPEIFPADEDNGEMAAWYVLGALGKIPAPAGSGRFVDLQPSMTCAARIKA